MKKIKNFVTTMTISGEGFSTGKSLMYEAIMLALYGKRLHSATPTTIPRLYEMLATGVPIYGMFYMNKNTNISQIRNFLLFGQPSLKPTKPIGYPLQ